MKHVNIEKPVILFADDDQMCLDVGVRMLQRLGYEVLEAKNGYDAVKIYQKNKKTIELVILDMRMPHNGEKTFNQIKAIDENAKILIASGYTEETRIRDLLKKGCNGFLQKPFNYDHLSQKVSLVLEN
jgi:DNA-binding NtrC family response regulator